MSTSPFSSLPRSFRLNHHQPFVADPQDEPIPLRKSSLVTTPLTLPTQLHVVNARSKAPSVRSNSSEDTLVSHSADPGTTTRFRPTKPRNDVDLTSYYHNDDNTTARITALPDLPPDLDALSRDDLERLTRLLFADSCRARWIAMSEQEKNKELERKLDKLSIESIRRQRQLLEAVEKQARDLSSAKEEAAGLQKRLGQVFSILSNVIPGLVGAKK